MKMKVFNYSELHFSEGTSFKINTLNLCLIGKIRHNFLVPRMIELACKTFMHIQTLVLHRVNGFDIISWSQAHSSFVINALHFLHVCNMGSAWLLNKFGASCISMSVRCVVLV